MARVNFVLNKFLRQKVLHAQNLTLESVMASVIVYQFVSKEILHQTLVYVKLQNISVFSVALIP